MQSTEGSGGRTIGFRLEPALEDRLRALAQSEGKSPGTYARDVLVDHLAQETELAKLRSRLSDLEVEMKRLRRDLHVDWYSAFAALLVAVTHGEKITPEAAKAWAQAQLQKLP
jgi:hypothetical protein